MWKPKKQTSSLRIKIFDLENKKATFRIIQPRNRGSYWNEAGIDAILHEIATDLENRFPTAEYKLVQVGPAAFNFVFIGTREVQEGDDGASEVGVQGGEQGQG